MQPSIHRTNDSLCDGDWLEVCKVSDLVPYSGICALVNRRQVALFYLPDQEPTLFAIANHDPIGRANVLSRGIAGDIEGEPVVASPLYKQHFSLFNGRCLEEEGVRIATYPVCIDDDVVLIDTSALL